MAKPEGVKKAVRNYDVSTADMSRLLAIARLADQDEPQLTDRLLTEIESNVAKRLARALLGAPERDQHLLRVVRALRGEPAEPPARRRKLAHSA